MDVVIVVFHPRLAELQAGLEALAQGCTAGLIERVHLWHNDGGPQATPGLDTATAHLRHAGVDLRSDGGRGNLGFGRAVNAVLPAVAAPYVLLLNQDAIPEPRALQRLWQTALADDADVAAWELRQLPYEHPKDYDPVTGETGWVSGAAVLLRTAALRAVGGFEPRFFMYCEDVDLSWRLRCAGWRLRYLPQCAVVHRTYDHPGQVKPLAALQGVYANLCLRTRFAGRRHVLEGIHRVLHDLRRPQVFAGHHRGLLLALLKFARNYAYFRRTRAAGPGFEPCFKGWDYEQRREGAFHAFRTQSEQTLPRPACALLVHASGDPLVLDEWLACADRQTHRPLEVFVLGGTWPGLAPIINRWTVRLDVRPLPASTAPMTALAALHAAADWCVTMSTDLRLPYADHVEVLLDAALEQAADAVTSLHWTLDAPHADRRQAHRRHAARSTQCLTAAQGGSVLRHRRTWAGPEPTPVLVGKVTTVGYLDKEGHR